MRISQLAGVVSLIALGGCAVVYSYGDYKDAEQAPATCQTAADCSVDDRACGAPVCEAGVCGVDPEPLDKPLDKQEPGDCHKRVCDGNGKKVDKVDDDDVPVDGKACTEDLCEDGVPSNPFVAEGTSCTSGSTATCDGSGNCRGCAQAEDCGEDVTGCSQPVCESGECKTVLSEAGTACKGEGSCTDRSRYFPAACDGMGNCGPAAVAIDCAPYGCTEAGCNTGCTTSADCGEKYDCDSGACMDCVTCGEWMLGEAPAGLEGISLCPHSRESFNAISRCFCGLGMDSCPASGVDCVSSICAGTTSYSDQCGPCIDSCVGGFHECQADIYP